MVDFSTSGNVKISGGVSVKGGVSNQGAAMAAGTISAGISRATDIFSSGQASAKARAKSAGEGLLANYQSELLKIADATDQGRLKPAQARLKARALQQTFIANNPSLAKDAAERHSKVLSSAGLGKVIGDSDPVDDAERKNLVAATEGGWVFSTMTDEEKNAGMLAYLKNKRVMEDISDETKKIGLENARVGLSKSEIALRQAEQKERGTKLLDDAATGVRFRVSGEIANTRKELLSGALTPEEATHKLKFLENKWAGEISQFARAAGNENVGMVLNPIKAMFELEREVISGKVSREVAENKQAYYQATITSKGLEDPALQKLYLIGKLLPNAKTSTYMAQFDAATKLMAKNSFGIQKVPYNYWDTNAKNEKALHKSVTDTLKENINKPAEGEEGAAQKEQVDSNIANMLKGVDVYKDAVESPEQLNQIVDFAASPEFAKWRKTGKLDQETADKAQAVLKERYMSEALPVIEQMWRTPSFASEHAFSNMEANGGQPVVAQEVIEVQFGANGLKFVPLNDDKGHQALANSYNRDIGPVVNKIVRAAAHLEGHTDYKKVFEENFGKAFDLKQDYDKSKLPIDEFNDSKGELEIKGSAGEDRLGLDKPTSVLDLIGNSEGTDKGRGYDETLGYGKFTNGDVNLTSMTLGEVKKLQSDMLKHPDNDLNSSALGRYQIVGKTLRALMKKMNLSDDEVFTPELQDEMAMELLKLRGLDEYKAGKISKEQFINNLAKEWASLPNTKNKGHYGGQKARVDVSELSKIIDSIA